MKEETEVKREESESDGEFIPKKGVKKGTKKAMPARPAKKRRKMSTG